MQKTQERNDATKEIEDRLGMFYAEKRKPVSVAFPRLKTSIIYSRRSVRRLSNALNPYIKNRKQDNYFPCVVARHQSLLRRKLGNSSPVLQERKITNLNQAIRKLDKYVIPPNGVFSFWHVIGKPTYRKGYVDGMLLSNGSVTEGVGGGLCQLSNLLFWVMQHAPMETVERHHHSVDAFPDSGRVCPFGSGATVFYNFVDLKMRNTSPYPLQIKVWLKDKHIKAQILSMKRFAEKFHLYERNHRFVECSGRYFRYNEIWRETNIKGKRQRAKKNSDQFRARSL